MNKEQFLKQLNIEKYGNLSEADDGYIVQLKDSDTFGLIYMKLEENSELEELEDNTVLTEQGSSVVFEDTNQTFLVSLLADWENDNYQLVVTDIKD